MSRKLYFLIAFVFTVMFFAIFNICAYAQTELIFTQKEKEFISATNNGHPLRIGIIPHLLPLSGCPPQTDTFTGINVEMLDLISEKTGIVFKYIRIPTEKFSPYAFLQTGEVALVAGTIRLERFTKDNNLILSERLSDGASLYITKKDFSPKNKKSGKISSKKGYQAGLDIATQEFKDYNIETFYDNLDVIEAVRTGKTDMAIINRYAGMYELQKPINADLIMFASLTHMIDSCIMGIKTPENELAISIINKALLSISPAEYNHVQMNYTILNPYELTYTDFLYKYRYILSASLFAIICISFMAMRLANSQKEKKLLSIDALTGAYTELGFNLEAQKFIAKSTKPLFIVDFDILNFQGYNELHGRESGDELLCYIVTTVKSSFSEKDIICRIYADDFKVLCSKENLDKLIENIKATDALLKQKAKSILMLSYGVYCITDKTVPITQMLDFAKQAKKSAKYTSDRNIGIFDTQLYQRSLREAELFSLFQGAIDSNDFLVYYQPKYDAITTKIASAEALVRWRQKDGSILSPFHFIDLFEKNGQIRRLDFYMLNKVCMFQKNLIDNNISPVPIAVNFSRVHLYSDNFVAWINEVVEKYGIAKSLIELEWTETAIMNDNSQAEKILKQLQDNGYTVAMDDFGSAYSSLNTLCNMPLDVIKLDRGFMLSTMNEIQTKRDKALKVINSVIALAKNLDLKVVAEGVETQEQYLFLKKVGCNYIQGYYFSKPLEEEKFLELFKKRTV